MAGSWQPENDLERALEQAIADPAAQPDFYRKLVESEIFVAQEGTIPQPSGRGLLAEGFELQVRAIEHNGREYVPIFTSLRRLRETIQDDVNYIALNAITFFEITKGADLILNPGSFGRTFSSEEVEQLLTGEMWQPRRHVFEKETQVAIGPPQIDPTQLTDTLSKVFSKYKEVRRAYVALLKLNPDEKPHTLVAIDGSGNFESVVAEATVAIRYVEVPDPPVDFIQLGQLEQSGQLEDYFASGPAPFYKRKRFGFF